MSLRSRFAAAAFLVLAPGLALSAQTPHSITIRSAKVVAQRATGEVEYSGEAGRQVEVQFGPTRLFADTLTVRGVAFAAGALVPIGEGVETVGIAKGNVRIDDPDGTVTADTFEYGLFSRVGVASQVVIRGERVVVQAQTLEIAEGKWVLTNVSATTCGRDKPLFLLSTPRLEIVPGRMAIARGLQFSLFGKSAFGLPYFRYSLDRRVQEFRPPTVTYQEGGKIGVTAKNGFLIGDRSAINTNISSVRGDMLRYDLQVVTSRVPAEKAADLITPRSELGERFNFGYFDNITVRSAKAERAYLESPRDSFGLGTFWNHRASSRWGGETLIKPWEIVYEYGGPMGPLAAVTQLRAERMGVVHGHAENRAQIQTSLALPSLTVGRGLSTHVRLDGSAYLGESGNFGWGAAQMGLVYSPLQDVTLGGAVVLGGEAGRSAFEADRLYSKAGASFRADWGRGPTKFSFLAKYDFSQKRWYDYEYSISQITGCIEPYIVLRRFPDEFAFGVSFRADEFMDKLRRRNFRGGD